MASWDEDYVEVSWCPTHGVQDVIGHRSSQGPDPYDIEKLRCGDEVIWMSGAREDCHIVGGA